MSLIFFSPRAICQQLLVYIRGQEAGHIFVVVVHFADKSDLVFSGVIGVILLPLLSLSLLPKVDLVIKMLRKCGIPYYGSFSKGAHFKQLLF